MVRISFVHKSRVHPSSGDYYILDILITLCIIIGIKYKMLVTRLATLTYISLGCFNVLYNFWQETQLVVKYCHGGIKFSTFLGKLYNNLVCILEQQQQQKSTLYIEKREKQ